jgi:hypothetical protein
MPPEVEEIEQEEIEQEEIEELEEDDEVIEEEPQRNTQAEALWDLLNSPATAKSTIQTIASNLGMSVGESKSEEGQQAIKDVIKLALGDDLAFLGDKLGPLGDAIEKLIENRISRAEVKINERAAQREANQFATVVDSTIKELDVETKGEFSSLLPKINKLMEEMPLGKQTPEKYLRRLFNLAKTESTSSVKTSTEKIERAKTESKKTTLKGTSNATRVIDGSSRNPSYREAISQAIKDASKK